jgi:predicted O-methyltransferase YrrM
VFSHTSYAERLALFQMAKALPQCARALEIGSHVGSSALFICAGLERGSGHLVCVDTWMNQTMPEGAKNTFDEFQANTRVFAHMITPVRKLSQELTEADVGGPLDFVLIDADHAEAAVRADFRLVAPWVKVGGLVSFHDVNHVSPGVGIVVGEALASGEWQLAGLVGTLGVITRIRS